MRTSKVTIAEENILNISPDANRNENSKVAADSSRTTLKYPFPYHAGVFSLAAKRYKAADREKNM